VCGDGQVKLMADPILGLIISW